MAGALPYYIGLLERCAGYFRSAAPDVAVLIDSPALHVPLGRIAREYGVPVLHFVTPQHWAWAPWRATSYASAVTRALTILPFEPAWFERRGVPVAHVGHPLLDELARVPATRGADSSGTIAVLPGSRANVIDLNLPWMLSVVAALRQKAPSLEVSIVQAGDRHRARIDRHVKDAGAERWTRIETGDLHASLSRARAAFSVSGTVLLELARRGISREQAYEWVQRSAMRAFSEQRDFKELLLADADVARALSSAEIEQAFDLGEQLKHVDRIFERVFQEAPAAEHAAVGEPVGARRAQRTPLPS